VLFRSLIGQAIGSDEFTVQDIVKQFDVRHAQANGYLRQWVQAGKCLLTGTRDSGSRPTNVYKFKEDAWT
jgi:hypothetical protein